MAPPVFKTGLAGIAFAGRFDSFPPPPPALPVQLNARRWDAPRYEVGFSDRDGNLFRGGLSSPVALGFVSSRSDAIRLRSQAR